MKVDQKKYIIGLIESIKIYKYQSFVADLGSLICIFRFCLNHSLILY
jgi:hypothetical protein